MTSEIGHRPTLQPAVNGKSAATVIGLDVGETFAARVAERPDQRGLRSHRPRIKFPFSSCVASRCRLALYFVKGNNRGERSC